MAPFIKTIFSTENVLPLSLNSIYLYTRFKWGGEFYFNSFFLRHGKSCIYADKTRSI